MTPRLTPFSYVVLTLAGEGGATAPELAEMMGRGRLFWSAPRSQWYAEPKRLADAGLLEGEEEPGRTGPRTRYRVTAAGRRALREWAATPAPLPRIQNEPLVRALAADLAGGAAVREGLAALRAELDAVEAATGAGEDVAHDLPARERVLLHNHRLARAVLAAHREWLDAVEAELGGR